MVSELVFDSYSPSNAFFLVPTKKAVLLSSSCLRPNKHIKFAGEAFTCSQKSAIEGGFAPKVRGGAVVGTVIAEKFVVLGKLPLRYKLKRKGCRTH